MTDNRFELLARGDDGSSVVSGHRTLAAAMKEAQRYIATPGHKQHWTLTIQDHFARHDPQRLDTEDQIVWKYPGHLEDK